MGGRTLTERHGSETAEVVPLETNIRIERYQTPPDGLWIHRDKADRLERYQDGALDPVEITECHNVTCIGLHEYLPELLNFHNDFDLTTDHPDAIAFGSDGTTTPTSSDTSMGTRVGEITLTDPASTGTEWSCTELVGALELNNENLRELGVESESGILYNHALLPTPLEPKSSNDELIVTITIGFASA